MNFPWTAAWCHRASDTRRTGAMLIVIASIVAGLESRGEIGADLPWTTYEAEVMKGTGTVLGPGYEPHRVETESSRQMCVKLDAAGEFVEFTASAAANALVVRYSLPDSAGGGGTNCTLELLINGKQVRTLALTSRYAWLYGPYRADSDIR